MGLDLTILGFRDVRPASCAEVASEVARWMVGIAPQLPREQKWTALDRSSDRVRVGDEGQLAKLLRGSVPVRASERASRAATHGVSLVMTSAGAEIIRAVLQFRTADEGAGGIDFLLEARLSDGAGQVDGGARARERGIFSKTIEAFRCTNARCVRPSAVARRDRPTNLPRVGWLTYLSRSLGPLPPIPPPTEVVPVGDLGWILVAQAEPVDPSNKDHQASLAYVRHALGARVLLDGPSFPPPASASPPEPPRAAVPLPDLSPAPLVPSYLRAPSGSTSAPASPSSVPVVPTANPSVPFPVTKPIPATNPPLAAKPFSTETADIDISKLVKATVPFDPKAPPAQRPDPPRPAPPPLDTGTTAFDVSEVLQRSTPPAGARPAAGFGETEEFSLASLLKSGPSLPFETPATPGDPPARASSPAPSPLAAGASPSAPPGHGRWIRFNPQTGEPLAAPYWEELSLPDRK